MWLIGFVWEKRTQMGLGSFGKSDGAIVMDLALRLDAALWFGFVLGLLLDDLAIPSRNLQTVPP
jgi:hypothetical protein